MGPVNPRIRSGLSLPRRAAATGAFLAALVVLAGCADPVFTEADEGQDREVARGSSFSISIPGSAVARRPDPQISGAFIRLSDRRLEGDPPREIFRFVAEGQGESDIRIAPPAGPEGASQLEYVIRVRIRPAAGPGAPSPETPKKY